METLLLAALSAAFVVNAIDELLFALGKWRGLIALSVSAACAFTIGGYTLAKAIFVSLGGGFAALVITVIISSAMPKEVARYQRGLPRRVPPL